LCSQLPVGITFRREAMINIEKAVDFIRSKGSEGEQARLKYLLTNEPLSAEEAAKLLSDQRADGGWAPFWAKDYSCVDATCFRLAQAEQLGITSTNAAVQRAIDFLAGRQFPDGRWEEEQQVADLTPFWARPGDLASTIYLTANCGQWLALVSPKKDQITRAANYLHAHLGEDGRLPGFLHSHWLAGSLWHRTGWQEPAKRVFGYLNKRINDLAVSNLAWLLTTLSAGGLRIDHPLVDLALDIMEQSQQDDGRWVSEDGPDQDVHTTLEALRALSISGRVKRRLTD
jgi:hypothetical protein